MLRAGVDLLRGYAGDITPAAALTAIESDVSWGLGAGAGGVGLDPMHRGANFWAGRVAGLELQLPKPTAIATTQRCALHPLPCHRAPP